MVMASTDTLDMGQTEVVMAMVNIPIQDTQDTDLTEVFAAI